ncbi:YncE family protein [Algoriphagus chordae]|uniref:DNA-binding beta-propeller fold protein YncE n=1 Tax=Algoriphagus chordae TaxID=237019 RepID=A0A2W7QEN5_9BACT|nr:YncE family protein [Algoriphagus chordae]PZX46984.1 DNA-binding beta-propeller fold protein YncE [Algoriphagus chordae]
MIKSLLLIAALTFSFAANAQNYYVYVTAESEDEVALIKFDGKNATIEETIQVGIWPAEIEGPHGINISPDGKYWYLSLAHGNPYGTLYKYSTETNEVVNTVKLGLFPASLQISKATGLLYCVNFDLHGDMLPSTVSVVDPEEMIEIDRIETGVMPHGSRISSDGMFHYSVGMMSGELFEISTTKLKVTRKLSLDGMEEDGAAMGGMDHSKMGHGMMTEAAPMYHSEVKPTWAMPHPTNGKVYVAGNGTDEVLEVDLEKWEITNRFKTGKAPYNCDVSPDGRYLVVTYKGSGETGIWDLESNSELPRVKNTRKVAHGVSISSDSKYAFISVEGIGGEPGTLDVIDIQKAEKVASVDMGKQAGGIIFWKME